MTDYTAQVSRDGRWWMIRLPQLDDYRDPTTGAHWPGEAVTQARRLADVQREAIDYAATVTGVATREVTVTVAVVGDLGALFTEAAHAAGMKEEAARLERDAVASSARVAQGLAAAGVTVRDIGEVLGVTYQRAAQLAQT